MGTNTYKITFSGEIKEESSLQQVKQRLNTLYKGNTKVVELLFEKKQVVLKKNLTMAQALKYKQVFDGSGAICQIAPMDVNFKKTKAPEQKEKISNSPVNDADVQEKRTDNDDQAMNVQNKKSSSLKWVFGSLFVLAILGGVIYHFSPAITEKLIAPSATQAESTSPATHYLLLN